LIGPSKRTARLLTLTEIRSAPRRRRSAVNDATERPLLAEIGRMLVSTNPHSLPKYRVNNVVANMPEFQRAFGCKKGQPMVRENACRIW
jgi:Peptidase family M13